MPSKFTPHVVVLALILSACAGNVDAPKTLALAEPSDRRDAQLDEPALAGAELAEVIVEVSTTDVVAGTAVDPVTGEVVARLGAVDVDSSQAAEMMSAMWAAAHGQPDTTSVWSVWQPEEVLAMDLGDQLRAQRHGKEALLQVALNPLSGRKQYLMSIVELDRVLEDPAHRSVLDPFRSQIPAS